MLKEKEICKRFFSQVNRLIAINYFKSKFCIFHVPNQQYTTIQYTFQLKAMGLTAGVADYCVLLSGGKVAFIEFKRHVKEKLSPRQELFKHKCQELNIPYFIVSDVDNGVQILTNLTNI